MSDDPYLRPGTSTLNNKLDLKDADALDRAERRLVADRIEEGKVPTGSFDLTDFGRDCLVEPPST